MQGVFARRLSSSGQKLGAEFQVNQTTAYNQHAPSVAALASGNYVVAWVSELQRFGAAAEQSGFNGDTGVSGTNAVVYSVDVYARVYDANGNALGNEFLVNTSSNVCANPVISANSDGSFTVAWAEHDMYGQNLWDVYARAFIPRATRYRPPIW